MCLFVRFEQWNHVLILLRVLNKCIGVTVNKETLLALSICKRTATSKINTKYTENIKFMNKLIISMLFDDWFADLHMWCESYDEGTSIQYLFLFNECISRRDKQMFYFCSVCVSVSSSSFIRNYTLHHRRKTTWLVQDDMS